MSAQVLVATAAGVVSLYAAAFHAWVFLQHRPARPHLWVALTAASAAAICFGAAMLGGGATPERALLAMRVQIVGAAGLTVGILRFGASRFRVEAPRLLRSADLFAVALASVAAVAPRLLLAPDRPPRRIPVFGDSLLQVELTTAAALLIAPALAYLIATMTFALRALRAGQPGARALAIALGVFLAAAIHDSAVALGVSPFPFLLSSGGYPVLVLTISAILMRDLIESTGRAERLGEDLQQLAQQRVDALRAVDLQLARGEQLAAIGTLAAGVAHEINNPLAYVSANLNHLEQLWREKAPDEVEVDEVLAECREGLARGSAIAADLLRMARQGASEMEPIDLSQVVRSVLPLVEREAAGRVRIETDLATSLPVVGCARLLGQVALNLAWNAIDAAADAPGVPRVTLITRSAGARAELLVLDSGPGIPASILGKIFEPSFTTKALGQGSGLGLALVHLIVTRHGGEIRAGSGSDGTAVTVRLPTVRGEES
jgi:C4-dicarboxylate-specific signal transduction histidine kinase